MPRQSPPKGLSLMQRKRRHTSQSSPISDALPSPLLDIEGLLGIVSIVDHLKKKAAPDTAANAKAPKQRGNRKGSIKKKDK